jgi:hypothetical protein
MHYYLQVSRSKIENHQVLQKVAYVAQGSRKYIQNLVLNLKRMNSLGDQTVDWKINDKVVPVLN